MQMNSCELNMSFKFTHMTRAVMHGTICITQQPQEGKVFNCFSCLFVFSRIG